MKTKKSDRMSPGPTLEEQRNSKRCHNTRNIETWKEKNSRKRRNTRNIETVKETGNSKKRRNTKNIETLKEPGKSKKCCNMRNIGTLKQVGNSKKHHNRKSKGYRIVSKIKKTNKSKQTFACPCCRKICNLRISLHKHMQTHHGVGVPRLLCPILKKTGNSKKGHNHSVSFNIDEPKWDTTTSLECEMCGKPFVGNFRMWSHIRDSHRKYAPYACGICLKICKDNARLLQHWKTFHPVDEMTDPGRYSCLVCGYQRNSRRGIVFHVIEVHKFDDPVSPDKMVLINEKQFFKADSSDEENPAISGSSSMSKPSLNTLSSYTPVKVLNETIRECSKCKISFSEPCLRKDNQDNYCKIKNLNLSKSKSVSVHTCEICSKRFPTPSRLREHQKRSHIPQSCEVCPDGSFNSKVELFNHIKENHSGHSNFTCPERSCSRITRSKSECELHHSHHMITCYPPTCDLCGEVYNSKEILLRHLNSIAHHKVLIPLTCGICFKYLPSKDVLLQHVKDVHPKFCISPNRCMLCGIAYSSIYTFLDHFSICHSDYNICKECLEVFCNRTELKVHSESGQCKGINARISEIEMKNKMQNFFKEGSELMKPNESEHKDDISYHNSRSTSHGKTKCDDYGDTFWKRPMLSYDSSSCDLGNSIQTDQKKINLPTCSNLNQKNKKVPKVYGNSPECTSCACQICGKDHPSRKLLWRHLIYNHRLEAAVTCGVCLEVCKDYNDLTLHLKLHHPGYVNEGKFTCHVCGRYTVARCKLAQHVGVHISFGPEAKHQPSYKCFICSKTCGNVEALKIHCRTFHLRGADKYNVKLRGVEIGADED
ncbi:hypothetical protein C0J52_02101 [Blattella germanica]|nr:hypothetical protein C0J52_02101 [Blattella germanica]